MPPETSAALVVFVEHPAKVPTATTASKPKHGLSVFIFSPFETTGPIRHEKSQTHIPAALTAK
jgi:hypothetical protein